MPSECNPRSTASQLCAVLRCKPEWSTARWRNIAVTMAYSAPDDPAHASGFGVPPRTRMLPVAAHTRISTRQTTRVRPTKELIPQQTAHCV